MEESGRKDSNNQSHMESAARPDVGIDGDDTGGTDVNEHLEHNQLN